MNLNLNTLAIIVTFVTTAVGGTWFALDHIYNKIENVRNDFEDDHYKFISRDEHTKDIDKLRLKMEKLDDKLTSTIIYHKRIHLGEDMDVPRR